MTSNKKKTGSRIKKVTLLVAVSLLFLGVFSYDVAEAQGPLGDIVAVNSTLGFGATGVYARRFQNVDLDLGNVVTYTSSAVNGDTFTIDKKGIYSISYTNFQLVGDTFSISLNSPATSDITDLSPADRLCSSSNPIGHLTNCTVSYPLEVGDVIRAHGSSGALVDPGISAFTRFVIVRMPD